MERWTVRIAVLAVIVLLALNLILPAKSVKSAQQYQYLVVRFNPVKLQQTLNQAASAGWEFIALSGQDDFVILRK